MTHTRKRVLIPTKVAPEMLAVFENYPGLEVEAPGDLSAEELAERLPQAHAVIIRSNNTVTAELIEAAVNLRVIGRAGTGLDNVDVEAATRRGIVVMNTPGVNAVSTAEHTLSMMLSLARKIPAADRSLKAGEWQRGRFQGVEVYGKTLGLVGLGRIGLQVAKRAVGLGMEVLAYDPYVLEDAVGDSSIRLVELDDIWRQADFISVHTPLVAATRHIINAKSIDKMKDGVRIIDCARGGIVDEEALCDGIDSGKIAGAALDVFEEEPPLERRVTRYEQIVTTPHLGGSTREAQVNVGLAIARQVADYLSSGVIVHAANAAPVTGETRAAVGPYLDLCEAMGSFAAQLCQGVLNRVKLTTHGSRFESNGKMLASAALKGLLSHSLEGAGVNWINAASLAAERGIEVEISEGGKREDYGHLIRLEVASVQEHHEVQGTQFGGEARLVNIDGYGLEMQPRGHWLLSLSRNRPGVIGKIGQIIGDHGVNINKLHNSCAPGADLALSAIGLDAEPVPGMLQALEGIEEFQWLRVIRLEGAAERG